MSNNLGSNFPSSKKESNSNRFLIVIVMILLAVSLYLFYVNSTAPEANDYTMDTTVLTNEDIELLDSDEAESLLNDIYARNGYIFEDEAINEHYEAQDWYQGTTTDMNEVYANMNDTEKQNADALASN